MRCINSKVSRLINLSVVRFVLSGVESLNRQEYSNVSNKSKSSDISQFSNPDLLNNPSFASNTSPTPSKTAVTSEGTALHSQFSAASTSSPPPSDLRGSVSPPSPPRRPPRPPAPPPPPQHGTRGLVSAPPRPPRSPTPPSPPSTTAQGSLSGPKSPLSSAHTSSRTLAPSRSPRAPTPPPPPSPIPPSRAAQMLAPSALSIKPSTVQVPQSHPEKSSVSSSAQDNPERELEPKDSHTTSEVSTKQEVPSDIADVSTVKASAVNQIETPDIAQCTPFSTFESEQIHKSALLSTSNKKKKYHDKSSTTSAEAKNDISDSEDAIDPNKSSSSSINAKSTTASSETKRSETTNFHNSRILPETENSEEFQASILQSKDSQRIRKDRPTRHSRRSVEIHLSELPPRAHKSSQQQSANEVNHSVEQDSTNSSYKDSNSTTAFESVIGTLVNKMGSNNSILRGEAELGDDQLYRGFSEMDSIDATHFDDSVDESRSVSILENSKTGMAEERDELIRGSMKSKELNPCSLSSQSDENSEKLELHLSVDDIEKVRLRKRRLLNSVQKGSEEFVEIKRPELLDDMPKEEKEAAERHEMPEERVMEKTLSKVKNLPDVGEKYIAESTTNTVQGFSSNPTFHEESSFKEDERSTDTVNLSSVTAEIELPTNSHLLVSGYTAVLPSEYLFLDVSLISPENLFSVFYSNTGHLASIRTTGICENPLELISGFHHVLDRLDHSTDVKTVFIVDDCADASSVMGVLHANFLPTRRSAGELSYVERQEFIERREQLLTRLRVSPLRYVAVLSTSSTVHDFAAEVALACNFIVVAEVPEEGDKLKQKSNAFSFGFPLMSMGILPCAATVCQLVQKIGFGRAAHLTRALHLYSAEESVILNLFQKIKISEKKYFANGRNIEDFAAALTSAPPLSSMSFSQHIFDALPSGRIKYMLASFCFSRGVVSLLSDKCVGNSFSREWIKIVLAYASLPFTSYVALQRLILEKAITSTASLSLGECATAMRRARECVLPGSDATNWQYYTIGRSREGTEALYELKHVNGVKPTEVQTPCLHAILIDCRGDGLSTARAASEKYKKEISSAECILIGSYAECLAVAKELQLDEAAFVSDASPLRTGIAGNLQTLSAVNKLGSSSKTSSLYAAAAYLSSLSIPIVITGAPGITERLVATLIVEACRLLCPALSPSAIDTEAEMGSLALSVGPFKLADSLGIRRVLEAVYMSPSTPTVQRQPVIAQSLLKNMCECGLGGTASPLGGFYVWSGEKSQSNTAVASLLAPTRSVDVSERLLFALVRECCQLLVTGCVHSASEANLLTVALGCGGRLAQQQGPLPLRTELETPFSSQWNQCGALAILDAMTINSAIALMQKVAEIEECEQLPHPLLLEMQKVNENFSTLSRETIERVRKFKSEAP